MIHTYMFLIFVLRGLVIISRTFQNIFDISCLNVCIQIGMEADNLWMYVKLILDYWLFVNSMVVGDHPDFSSYSNREQKYL